MSLIKEAINFIDFNNALIYETATDCELALFQNSSEDDFEEKCEIIENNGFVLLNENSISDNYFKFYKNDSLFIAVGFYSNDSTIRLVVDKKLELPTFSPCDNLNKVAETKNILVSILKNIDNI